MRNRKSTIWGLIASSAMLVMILDAKTTFQSAQSGLLLCIRTVIPSLFPFFILSGILNSCLLGHKTNVLKPLGRLCKIPTGGESLLLIGLLGGYPVGAQIIAQVYQSGNISRKTAHRILGFCNNAGPAFLFGMLSPLFTNSYVPWIIWSIHIVSALLIGCFLPGKKADQCNISPLQPISFPKSLQNATKNIISVCGWVIAFRVIVGFFTRWFLWLFPEEMQVLLCGLLELSNGIVLLNNLPSEALRFVLSSFMLAFGGLCVAMQTASVTEDLGLGYYIPGKIIHALLATVISILLLPILFKHQIVIPQLLPFMIVFIIPLILIPLLRRKKVVAFT